MSLSPTPEDWVPAPIASSAAARARRAGWVTAWRLAQLLAATSFLLMICLLDRRRAPSPRADAGPSLASRWLSGFLERAGGLWLKLAQALSYRSDILPERICAALAHLQDSVAPMPARLRELAVARARQHPNGRIGVVDEQPVGAGCVAQVHAAWDHDGRKYALKLRRVDAPDRMNADLRVLDLLAGVARRLPSLSALPIFQVVQSLSAFMLQQMDLKQEAQRTEVVRKFFLGDATCRIPRALPERSHEEFALFEYLDDLKPIEHPSIGSAESEQLARASVSACFRMLFDLGLVHADMHPGNLYVSAEGRLVILDFGLMAELDVSTKRGFREFFLAFVSDNGATCARILLETAIAVPGDLDRIRFAEAVETLVSRHANKTAQEFQCASFVHELFRVQKRFGIVGGTDFVLAVASILMLEGVVKRLDPSCDFQQLARVMLPPIIGRTVPRRPWSGNDIAWSYPDRLNRTSYVQQVL